MRKSKADTIETRKKIVSMASRLFQDKGIGATSIADVMAAADLTQGGFYRHFESKEELIAEANDSAFAQLLDTLQAKIAGKSPKKSLEIIVTSYLYQLRRVNPAVLCPLANIGSELSRADKEVMLSANRGFESVTKLIAEQTKKMGLKHSTEAADLVCSALVGAVTLSRLSVDAVLVERTLANTQKAIMRAMAAWA